ncbi:MAG: hypothetical protein IPG06_13185 [Haliea sp.]|nr:hypothetical protein [Haliea sp.]
MSQRANTRSLALCAGVSLALGVLAGCSSSNDSAAPGDTAAPVFEWPEGEVTVGPLVSGTSSTIDGILAWTDFVYDDRGPNTDAGDMTDMASAGGDAAYPGDLTNAADFVQVLIAGSGDGVRIRVVLETLLDPAVPLVGIAFDTDNNSATGAATLPGAWQPDGALGVELLVVLAQGAGEILEWDGGQWRSIADLDVAVDADNNTLEATLPAAVAAPGEATWNAIGVAGTTTTSWLTGAGVIHDLAFVADEPFYQWQDYRQSDILSGKAPVNPALAAIDFGRLADGMDALPDATAPGFHTYLYHSELELAEGIVETADGAEFLGPYQPYLVYIPEAGYQSGEAMTVFLHGLTQNHLGSVIVGDTVPRYRSRAVRGNRGARDVRARRHRLPAPQPDGVAAGARCGPVLRGHRGAGRARCAGRRQPQVPARPRPHHPERRVDGRHRHLPHGRALPGPVVRGGADHRVCATRGRAAADEL